MTSIVRAEGIAECPFSVAAEYTVSFLKRDADEPGRFVAHLGPLRWPVTSSFGVHYGIDDGVHGHDEIRFAWRARTRWLPDLTGTLRLAIATYRTTEIALAATYEPPLGLPGRLFDAAIGRRLAAATAHDFVERIVAALEAEERVFRAHHPNAS